MPGRDDEFDETTMPREVYEFLNQRHDRSSINVDGGRLMIQPGKVLDKLEEIMERLDVDIMTPVGVEDVATFDEWYVLFNGFQLGPTLCCHVANHAMKIMLARYPEHLARMPLQPHYDLRVLLPQLQLADDLHARAVAIMNRRMPSRTDLEPDDIETELDGLDWEGQMHVFIALFFIYGTKVSAMQDERKG